MLTGDGAAVRVRSQQVGGDEKRRGEEGVLGIIGKVGGGSAKHVGANRISQAEDQPRHAN